MKALVIGGTGFIGRRLVDYLLRDNFDVAVATSGKTENPFGEDVETIVFDRFNRASMEAKLYSPPFYDIVYDLLGFRLRDVIDIAEIFEGRTSRYVFVSSAAVYTGKSGVLSEDDFDPLSLDISGDTVEKEYAEGKRRCEAYLFQKAHFPVAVARFPNVLGHDDSTLRFQKHISMIENDETFIIPESGGRRNYVWVDDAGRFLLWLGKSGKTGAYNGASTEIFYLREIIEDIASAMGKEAIIKETHGTESNSRYFSKNDFILSTRKAIEDGFFFTPSKDWIQHEVSEYMKSGGISPNSSDYSKDLF